MTKIALSGLNMTTSTIGAAATERIRAGHANMTSAADDIAAAAC